MTQHPIVRMDSTFEARVNDIEEKPQEYHDVNNESIIQKRNRWVKIGVAVLIVTALISVIIAVPVSIAHRKKGIPEYTSPIHASADVPKPTLIENKSKNITDTNVTAASLPTQHHRLHKSHSRLLVTAANQISYNPPGYAHAISPYSSLIRLKTFTPPDEGRIFVMGDIHGCIDEMNALLKKIDFQPENDVLILAGDLVFRGKDSVGVIRRAKELNALCVRGNHDDKVIRFRGYQNEHGIDNMPDNHEVMPEGKVGDPLKFNNKHKEIATEMSEEEYNYLASCPLILDIPKLSARVVHGGLDPSVKDLINNDPWSVMNMRDMNSHQVPSKSKLSKNQPSSSNVHWTSAYQSYSDSHNLNTTVYYGHDASRGITLGEKTIGVDSGCVYGRKLSVIDIRNQNLYQVDCNKNGASEAEEEHAKEHEEDEHDHKHQDE